MDDSKQPTLEDIAKILGLSRATVSNALTGNRYVSPVTKQKVLELTKELGYEKNILAQSLRTRKTNVIGVTVPDISEPYLSLLVRNLEKELKRVGYDMILGTYYFDITEEVRIIGKLKRFMVDGIIAISGLNSTNNIYNDLASNIPIVFLERHRDNLKIQSVYPNHYEIGKDAVNYLYSKGHKKIAHLTIPYDDFSVVRMRAEGFNYGLKKNKMESDKTNIVIDSRIRLHEIQTSIDIAKRIVKTGATAIFVVSDYVALGLMKGLNKLGKKIPNDISILSVTNIDYCLATTPTLTSIDLSPDKSTKLAAKAIHRLCSGKSIGNLVNEIDYKIIERESVADIN